MKNVIVLVNQKGKAELVNLDKIVFAIQVYDTCEVTFTNKDKRYYKISLDELIEMCVNLSVKCKV